MRIEDNVRCEVFNGISSENLEYKLAQYYSTKGLDIKHITITPSGTQMFSLIIVYTKK